MVNQVIERPCRVPGEGGIGLLEQRVVRRLAGFQRVWQGPGVRKVNGHPAQGMQAAVPPHVTREIISLSQVGLGPLPGPSPIQQFPDYREVATEKVCGLILGINQNADNHVQAHSEEPYQ